ncbi:MAG: CotH kinase family protein [Prolixibacteraceae bacterium]|nr:CotH kinase family protein [Prolixibacteraceae bacterium]
MQIKKFFIILFLLSPFVKIFSQHTEVALNNSLNASFSPEAGFYNNPFTLHLSAPGPGYFIVYTIDGSNPQHAATAIKGGNTVEIEIDPSHHTGRAQTPCYIVRASVTKDGFTISRPVTQTYIFIDEVIDQEHPGGEWPSSYVNTQEIDLAMDPDITQSFPYASQIVESLTDIPSLSIVTDLENLFDPHTGIYVNAMERGEEWERFCSFELLYPSGKKGFSVNAGLRIRGGWSRHGDYPKHAFRLLFKAEYGAAKLYYPLFGDEGVGEFDKIDIRCEQNYAWSNGYGNNTCVREVFSRDTQRDMGQPYTRSRYYHLYLNGMYWGLYQTQERAEARYAADYFGGSKNDYDVVKVNSDGYVVEVTDGTIDSWQRLYNVCKNGFSTNTNYFALEGKDERGLPKSGSEILVDVDNLIDYMLTIFYTGNFDAPISAFLGNAKANNFYSIYKRDDKTKGFIFFNHDAEHAMMVDPMSPGIGLYEDRVNLELRQPALGSFTPQWLHVKLSENKEYRQRFADRVYLHFFNNGVFTPEKARERFEKRVAEIEMAIIAESARWGDAKTANPFTKEEHWWPEIEDIYDRFFPYRTDIVLDQLNEAGLFPAIPAPEFKHNGQKVTSGFCTFDESIEIIATTTVNDGELYITRDGHDPRNIGGSVYKNVRKAYNGFSMVQRRSTIIKARVKKGDKWSPMHTLCLLQNNTDFSELKVTELSYHPPDSIIGEDTISGKSFEFIELKNIGDNSINLSGLSFSSAIEYVFPDKELLAPKSFYVIASKPKWFYEKYNMVPSGNFSKNLSNGGEQVILINAKGKEIFNFTYDDENPWYPEADGQGYTITSKVRDPWGWDPVSPYYWKVSTFINGSPFANDPWMTNALPDMELAKKEVMVYPNPAKRFLFVDVSSSNKEYQIEIITLSGKNIYRASTKEKLTIDLGSLPLKNGLLLVKINRGNKFTLQKILYRP